MEDIINQTSITKIQETSRVVIQQQYMDDDYDGDDSDYYLPEDEDTCETCDRECTKIQECEHACALGKCHLNACPPCPVLLPFPCHCNARKIYLPCSKYRAAKGCEKTLNRLLSCASLCGRELKNCNHTCIDVCHPGNFNYYNFI